MYGDFEFIVPSVGYAVFTLSLCINNSV